MSHFVSFLKRILRLDPAILEMLDLCFSVLRWFVARPVGMHSLGISDVIHSEKVVCNRAFSLSNLEGNFCRGSRTSLKRPIFFSPGSSQAQTLSCRQRTSDLVRAGHSQKNYEHSPQPLTRLTCLTHVYPQFLQGSRDGFGDRGGGHPEWFRLSADEKGRVVEFPEGRKVVWVCMYVRLRMAR